jgi:hypothetical protein
MTLLALASLVAAVVLAAGAVLYWVARDATRRGADRRRD